MKTLNLSCLLLLLLAAGCKPKPATPDATGTSVKTYEAHGLVRAITADRHTATIQHDAIPGFMSAMTMDFTVKATNELNGIATNDEINFKLVVAENESWVEDVRFVSHRIENDTNTVVTMHMSVPDLKPGDLLPDYELTTEDGGKVHLADFRGRVLAFTFFFTRCPLSDFCPRMSRDFSEARQLLLNSPNAPTNWQFLSISFDSAFDQPAVLSAYANSFREGNTDRWLFAAASPATLADLAPKLDLMVAHDGESFSHNLRTVVLDPQGRIFRQFDGNKWTPQQLADAMLAAARGEAPPPPPKVQSFDE
jgi:protein SCO1/2